MPSVDTERSDSSDVTGMPFTKIEVDETDVSSERWTKMSDEVFFHQLLDKYH